MVVMFGYLIIWQILYIERGRTSMNHRPYCCRHRLIMSSILDKIEFVALARNEY